MALTRILLYVRDVEKTAHFYKTLFGLEIHRTEGDRIVELADPQGGANLMLHPAAKGQKTGQSTVKLVFSVPDVDAFCVASSARGFPFGPIHRAGDYSFANTRDPDGNSVSVSSRGIAVR
ncbi:VOC family protein [Shinella sp. CPCC 101442]|uniref:VOC family protein n=1 Tax=Shinella sp. CPCC 101442 TaxID=2932265 RepID=UPI00215242B7|nr:VOC family protein [Shinella sp. CPCC 101442]MCR6499620.1 VOC family protein [Shinella sp. CPCC 101442]